MNAESYLKRAEQTMQERGKTYDSSKGERSAARAAAAASAITGKDITAKDIWLIMLLLKQVRQWSSPTFHEDSALDSVAYAALLAEELENVD